MAVIRRYAVYMLLSITILYLFYTINNASNTPKYTSHRNPDHEKSEDPLVFNWAKLPHKNVVVSMAALPSGQPSQLPRIQHNFEAEDSTARTIREARQAEVKKQFVKCWNNYRKLAWGHDELKPITGEFKDPFGGWAATMIDALDTLLIMGLKNEFHSAIDDVVKVNFGSTNLEKINVFETNIRHLGGLLSAYELSGEKRLLGKAKEVGEMLLHAFDTPSRMPITRWNLNKAGLGESQVADDVILLAELGSFSMEFTRLSQATGDSRWYDAANRITLAFEKSQMSTLLPGMWPVVINAKKIDFTVDDTFTLSSMADSAYEYLPKTYALLGGLEPVHKKLYERAMNTAIKHIFYKPMTPEDTDMLGTGALHLAGLGTTVMPEFQHLSCYTGGMLELGGKLFQRPEHIEIGRKLTNTCVWAYKVSQAGIMPEVSHLMKCPPNDCTWNETLWKEQVSIYSGNNDEEKDPLQNIANLRLPKGFASIDDRRYILRPEAIESVFIMYRITGEQQWQAAAWDMWTAIMAATNTELANAALRDVSAEKPSQEDSMESFWMAETLKYFYLIFSTPDTISLDDYVFNTEAHPLKIPKGKR